MSAGAKIKERWIEGADSSAMIPLFRRPECIDIVVVGGVGGKSAAYLGFNSKPYPIKK